MARMGDQIGQQDVILIAFPHELGRSMAPMAIDKQKSLFSIISRLRKENLIPPTQTNVIGRPAILRSRKKEVWDAFGA